MRQDETRVAVLLSAFFLALLIPTLVLALHSYRQLEWEAFQRHRLLAEELAERIDLRLKTWIGIEEDRSVADYAFLVVSGENYVTRSPLSGYPVQSSIPGVRSYFQVNTDGTLTTPLLPADGRDIEPYGVNAAERQARAALQAELGALLGAVRDRDARENPARAAAPATVTAAYAERSDAAKLPSLPTQALFDRLGEKDEVQAGNTLGKVDDLKLSRQFEAAGARAQAAAPAPAEAQAKKRFEANRVAEEVTAINEPAGKRISVGVFESEVDPLRFAILDAAHFVLFRKVWTNGQRLIQGMVIDQAPFLAAALEQDYRDTVLSQMSDMSVAYEEDVLALYGNRGTRGYLSRTADVTGDLLYRASLAPPLDRVQLIFSVADLPLGTGAITILWTAALMMVVLVGGFLFMYRLALGRIRLHRQQQDFVSAVSHELKTPLTSIRMYGEILKAGWADEQKKRSYYEFIFDESERLTRLINNVLRLSRLDHNGADLNLQRVVVQDLLRSIETKLASQITANSFALEPRYEEAAMRAVVEVDSDAFTQIMINLVDNAMKFSVKADRHVVQVGARLRGGLVEFSVRDFGEGIARDQLKKIFELFYRAESELTRETVGTGIGLALVRRLADEMHGKVDVVNREPGAEFRVTLPVRND